MGGTLFDSSANIQHLNDVRFGLCKPVRVRDSFNYNMQVIICFSCAKGL